MTGTQTAIALIIAFLGLSLPFMLPHLIAKAVRSLIGFIVGVFARIVCGVLDVVRGALPARAVVVGVVGALAELVTVVSWGWAAWRTVVLSSRHWAAWKAGGSTQVIVLGVVGAVSLIMALVCRTTINAAVDENNAQVEDEAEMQRQLRVHRRLKDEGLL